MNILVWILTIASALLGVGTNLVICAVMIGTIVKKIYRKVKFGESLYH